MPTIGDVLKEHHLFFRTKQSCEGIAQFSFLLHQYWNSSKSRSPWFGTVHLHTVLTREKGVDKEVLANEIRCRIGCLWPLRGSVACFHELYTSQPKFLMSKNGASGGGFDLVDLKCAENNCFATPVLANLR